MKAYFGDSVSGIVGLSAAVVRSCECFYMFGALLFKPLLKGVRLICGRVKAFQRRLTTIQCCVKIILHWVSLFLSWVTPILHWAKVSLQWLTTSLHCVKPSLHWVAMSLYWDTPFLYWVKLSQYRVKSFLYSLNASLHYVKVFLHRIKLFLCRNVSLLCRNASTSYSFTTFLNILITKHGAFTTIINNFTIKPQNPCIYAFEGAIWYFVDRFSPYTGVPKLLLLAPAKSTISLTKSEYYLCQRLSQRN
jgi:hypothetical protein